VRVIAIAAALVLAACGSTRPEEKAPPQPSTVPFVFDLGRDFSFTANPNGPWRYGYTTGSELTGGAFTPMAVVEHAPPMTFWHPGRGQAGYYPYIAAAQDRLATVTDQTGSWTLRPNEIALEASNTGEHAVIEFIAPVAGTFAISADFTGIHKGVSTTDAQVRIGDEILFRADVTATRPTANFRATRTLNAGDVLTFAIGYGANRTHYNDTTGLILTIRSVATSGSGS
jgi:hypothetical protein